MFVHKRHVQFYETDAMAMVHHSNFVRYLEEARVEWLREMDFFADGHLLEDINFPVLDLQMEYKNPIQFNDEVSIELKATVEGVRLIFNYILTTKRFDKPVAFGKTVHVAFDMKTRKPTRMPREIVEAIKAQGQKNG